MTITLTDSALDQLKTTEIKEERYPRIDAEMAGGCGISVKLKLVFDGVRRKDSVIEYEGIQIRIDRFSKRYLDEETQIDYNIEQGFLIGTSFISSACAIELD
ncbi:iron-sulfur cluster biosynthesis family protein [Virgibacillus sp. NKC19-3]|uniref:iron-sulfur cluster biosynthesis family protein n=1 Tax=Virgibacillus saliphilus TaxID=2831674 RepID=UPI001C9AF3EF|nr:iron-sulfur cluster biosynthesis family protein [Virgibacillus sp. NKC19-3]MBY7144199.1 iron-sulfur cluster biosynthesis family protein [Virgibacillus sp. NKC19-3]